MKIIINIQLIECLKVLGNEGGGLCKPSCAYDRYKVLKNITMNRIEPFRFKPCDRNNRN